MPETEAGTVYLGVKLDDQQFKRQMATLASEAQRIMQEAVSGGTFQLDTSAIEKSINNVARSVDTLGDNLVSTFSKSMEKGAVEGMKQTARVVNSATFPKIKIEFSEARLKEQIDLMGQRWQALDAQRVAQAQKVARLQETARYGLAGTPDAQKANEELARARLKLADIKMAAAQADAQVFALEQQLERMGQVGQAAPQKTTMAMDQMQYSAQRTGFRVSSAMSGMATASRSAFTRFANGAKTFISRLKDMVKHLNIFRRSSGSAFGGMNPLMKFGLMAMGIRSTYMLVRRLVNVTRQGFEEMGKQFDGFQGKITRLKDSLGTLKASFSGMLAPAFEALLPMIETVVSRLVDAFNTIGIFMARIFGQSTYKMVTGYNSAVEASAGAAGASDEAHKKLFRTLASFDELEILRGPGTTRIGTGSIGSGGATAGSPIYKEIAIEPFLGTFSLADTINQWVAGIDATAIGRQISDKFALAFEKTYKFLEKIDWWKIGEKVGDRLNALDWYTVTYNLGRTIFSFFKGLPDLLSGWLLTTNWKKIGTNIGRAISDLDWEGTIKSIARAIWAAFSGLVDILAGFFLNTDWAGIGESIYKGIASVNWISVLERAAEVIGGAFGALLGALFGLLKGAWRDVKKIWEDYFFDNGKLTFESFFDGMNSLLGKGSTTLINLAVNLTAGILDALGLKNAANMVRSAGEETGKQFSQGFMQGISYLFEEIETFLQAGFNWLLDDPNSPINWLFGPPKVAPPSTGGASGSWGAPTPIIPSTPVRYPTTYTAPPPTSGSGGKATSAMMAAGGYVTQPTLAMVGEQSKKEVVLPLERNTEWARLLANELRGAGASGGDIHITQPIYLGTDQLIGVIETVVDREGRLRNKPVFA